MPFKPNYCNAAGGTGAPAGERGGATVVWAVDVVRKRNCRLEVRFTDGELASLVAKGEKAGLSVRT